jgi:hypothetical protein
VPLVEQERPTLPEHLSTPLVFSGGSRYSIFSFMCMFCRSLFVLLYFFFWPLCCLFFFDLRILITPLVSSNSSYANGLFLNTILFCFLDMFYQLIIVCCCKESFKKHWLKIMWECYNVVDLLHWSLSLMMVTNIKINYLRAYRLKKDHNILFTFCENKRQILTKDQ